MDLSIHAVERDRWPHDPERTALVCAPLTAADCAPDLVLRPEDGVLGLRLAGDHAGEHVGDDVAVGDELDALVRWGRPAVEVRELHAALERLVLGVDVPDRMVFHVAPARVVVVVARQDPLVVLRGLEEPAEELTRELEVLAELPNPEAARGAR